MWSRTVCHVCNVITRCHVVLYCVIFGVWYCTYCIFETSCKIYDSGVVINRDCIPDDECVNTITFS